jgi:hypothetical protein
LRVRNFPCCTRHLAWSLVIITLTGKMAARLNTIVAIAMLALYDEFDTYWQNGGYKKISDIIFAECHIFIVSNLWLNERTTWSASSRINAIDCLRTFAHASLFKIAHACNITTYLAKHCWRWIRFDSKYTVLINCVLVLCTPYLE